MKTTLLFLSVFLSVNLFGQSISTLELKNGFKDIKLGSDIRDYKNIVDKCPCNSYLLVEVDYLSNPVIQETLMVGRLANYQVKTDVEKYKSFPVGQISRVYIYTDNFLIYKIVLAVPRNIKKGAQQVHRFSLEKLRDAFGPPHEYYTEELLDFDIRERENETYYEMWSGENISLHVISINGDKKWEGTKRRLYLFTYEDKVISSRIKQQEERERKEKEEKRRKKTIDGF